MERFRKRLHDNTRSDESVKGDARRGAVSVRRPGSYFKELSACSHHFFSTGGDHDLPYFCSSSDRSVGDRLYPKLRRASESSDPSIDPERSLSKCLKTFCQSWMYFHRPANSGEKQ